MASPRGPRDGDAARESGRRKFSLTQSNKPKPKPKKKTSSSKSSSKSKSKGSTKKG